MRESGILMPVSSLPGPYGIGCFGKKAEKFVDFLAAAGQKIWQILPLSPTGYGDSPYQSCSAFAGNPYFIDLDALKAEGLLTAAQLKAEPWGKDPLNVDYGTLYTSRYKVLRAAYAAWRRQCAGQHGCAHYYPDAYYAFTLENEGWLEDYALYMALKTANGMKSWTQWPREYRKREPQALEAFKAENEEEIGFWKFLQYEFSIQWKKLKAYANANNVQILGDIPIYVSADSVDAWVGGPLFELDADGGFARVAGCPPDYFSAEGQLWGNPLYNWPYHKQTGYAWWIQRVRHALGIYDLLRIDHFRGFDTYWAIPADSTTAKTGKWETGPRMELFNALEGALGKLPIIAEDLGELFPSVRELLADSTFPGMKVLQFAFGGGDSEYLPHNHVKNSVVYPGTHDNTTLTAWWDESASAKEKAVAAAYLHLTGCQPTAKEVAAVKTEAARTALLRAALGSVADRAIIPMADWLGLGEEAHLNSPGKLGGNWIGRHQRVSPALRRRPAAKEVPSIGFLPSGTTWSSWTAPSAQATVRGFVESTVPGASPLEAATRHSVTLTFLPPAVTNQAMGQGFMPRTQLWMCAAVSVSLNSASSLSSMGARVAFSCCWGWGWRVPASMAGTVSQRTRAPTAVTRSNSSPLVSSGPMAIFSQTSTSPVSNPSSICMMETPVSVSPFRTAHCTGALPRYLGSRDTCRLMQPYFGASSTDLGRMQP